MSGSLIDSRWHALETLVLVPGHAIYVAPDFDRPLADESWALQRFQTGEPPFYVEHIEAGIRLAADDRSSLLIFSGGQTREAAGPRTEAQSYWLIAEHMLHWSAEVRSRSSTEEYARDSFENLLFGICRFFECTARFPKLVRVVGWRFKQARFELHRSSLRLPRDRFEYVGVNDPVDLRSAMEGERSVLAQFAEDPYGIRTAPAGSPATERRKYLGEKRKDRNPFNRHSPYSVSCPELARLLAHSTTTSFDGHLPW